MLPVVATALLWGLPAESYDAGAVPVTLHPRTPLVRRGEARHRVFVNFDGVTLEHSGFGDDAPGNETQFEAMATAFAPFGEEAGGATRTAIMHAVNAHFAELSVDFVTTRPTEGVYSMMIVSPTGARPGKLGFASLNCGGSSTGIGFAHFRKGGADASKIAATVSHELAHTLGIEHSSDRSDLMYPTSQPGELRFIDDCVALDDASAGLCDPVHLRHCDGEARTQNTFAELFDLLGPVDVDPSAPEVAIESPACADHVQVGDRVHIVARASDDTAVQQVKFWLDERLLGTLLEPPYEKSAVVETSGRHTVRVVAIDSSGNEAEDQSAFIAGEGTLSPGDCEAVPGADDGGDENAATGNGGGEGSTGGPNLNESGGCQSADGVPPGAAMWAALATLGAGRRRGLRGAVAHESPEQPAQSGGRGA